MLPVRKAGSRRKREYSKGGGLLLMSQVSDSVLNPSWGLQEYLQRRQGWGRVMRSERPGCRSAKFDRRLDSRSRSPTSRLHETDRFWKRQGQTRELVRNTKELAGNPLDLPICPPFGLTRLTSNDGPPPSNGYPPPSDGGR